MCWRGNGRCVRTEERRRLPASGCMYASFNAYRQVHTPNDTSYSDTDTHTHAHARARARARARTPLARAAGEETEPGFQARPTAPRTTEVSAHRAHATTREMRSMRAIKAWCYTWGIAKHAYTHIHAHPRIHASKLGHTKTCESSWVMNGLGHLEHEAADGAISPRGQDVRAPRWYKFVYVWWHIVCLSTHLCMGDSQDLVTHLSVLAFAFRLERGQALRQFSWHKPAYIALEEGVSQANRAVPRRRTAGT